MDGNLARARGEVSRLGRFFDSLTDFVVTTLVYAGITTTLVRETGEESLWVLGSLALLSCLIHCSYFVYYMVSYTSITGVYRNNRVNEEITSAELEAVSRGELSAGILTLQRLHGWIYGWQDQLSEVVDNIVYGFETSAEKKQNFLEEQDVTRRMENLRSLLDLKIEIIKLSKINIKKGTDVGMN